MVLRLIIITISLCVFNSIRTGYAQKRDVPYVKAAHSKPLGDTSRLFWGNVLCVYKTDTAYSDTLIINDRQQVVMTGNVRKKIGKSGIMTTDVLRLEFND